MLLTTQGTQLRISQMTNSQRAVVDEFIHQRLTTYKFPTGRRKKREIDAIYVTPDSTDLLFHSNVLHELITHLTNKRALFSHTELPAYTPRHIDVELNKEIIPRQYQLDAIDVLAANDGSPSKLLGFQPGAGKTITFLCYVARQKHVACAVMRSQYCAQWLKVIPTILNIKQEEILYINSGAVIHSAIKELHEGTFNYKFILFGNRNLHKYIKPNKSKVFGITMSEFMRLAGVGTVLIDEVHEDLHLNYLLCASIAVPKVIGLSGTFITRDNKIKYFHQHMFPDKDRYDFLTRNPYITYIEANFSFPPNVEPKTSLYNSPAYNQLVYEGWLLANSRHLKSTLEHLIKLVNAAYIDRRNPNDKLLIFVMRVEMAEKITEVLSPIFPDVQVIVYAQGSEYDNLFSADIITSTPIKSGASVDISGLITVISMYMTMSIQRLFQMLGRLRYRENTNLIYVQMVCKSVPKHTQYQEINKLDLIPKTKEYHTMYMN